MIGGGLLEKAPDEWVDRRGLQRLQREFLKPLQTTTVANHYLWELAYDFWML